MKLYKPKSTENPVQNYMMKGKEMREIVKAAIGKGMSYHNKMLRVIEIERKNKPWLRRVSETGRELKLKNTYPRRDIIN